MRLLHSRLVLVLMLAILCSYAPALPSSQSPAEAANHPASLWKDPGNVAAMDFSSGPGGDVKPEPPFQFVSGSDGGSSPKVTVRDKNDRIWAVKFGFEAPAEVFATRLAWAAGYFVQPTFFIPEGRILNSHPLDTNDKARAFIHPQSGAFTAARFQLRDKDAPKPIKGEAWAWDKNPFVGTHELNGLKILMMLTSNWDPKDADKGDSANTAIFDATQHDGQVYYVFTDWGASMGRWGNVATREKWDCEGYAKQSRKFVKGVRGDVIEWGYSGKNKRQMTSAITVEDVRWLMRTLGQVTDEQLRAGLRSSGATEEQVECFQHAIRDRLTQLQYIAETGESPK